MKQIRKFQEAHPFFNVVLILTLFIILFFILMRMYFPPGEFQGYSSFIVAFEFARCIQDVFNLLQTFSAEDIGKIDIGNYLDFGFMISYSLLLGYLFVKSAKIFKKRWLIIGIPLAIIIFIGDLFENIILLRITHIYVANLDESEIVQLVDKLQIITWVKWGSLAFAFFIFYEVLRRLHWFFKISGLVCLFPLLYILILKNYY